MGKKAESSEEKMVDAPAGGGELFIHNPSYLAEIPQRELKQYRLNMRLSASHFEFLKAYSGQKNITMTEAVEAMIDNVKRGISHLQF